MVFIITFWPLDSVATAWKCSAGVAPKRRTPSVKTKARKATDPKTEKTFTFRNIFLKRFQVQMIQIIMNVLEWHFYKNIIFQFFCKMYFLKSSLKVLLSIFNRIANIDLGKLRYFNELKCKNNKKRTMKMTREKTITKNQMPKVKKKQKNSPSLPFN